MLFYQHVHLLPQFVDSRNKDDAFCEKDTAGEVKTKLADILLEVLIALGYNDMYANTERSKYGAAVMYNSGNTYEAVQILSDLKRIASIWRDEGKVLDPDSEGYYNRYMTSWIKKYMEIADYVSAWN